jgi:glycosyltransferase involved in cell wall biosynthesis
MRLGIISTIGDQYQWAGSEETWRLLAVEALATSHTVSLCAPSGIINSTQVGKLRQSGAMVFPRQGLNAVTRRLSERRLYSRFKQFFAGGHDVIFLSMGGVADCIWIPDLLCCLKQTTVPVVVFVQANAEGVVGEESHREILRDFYARAALVIFLSKHNYQLAERQLAWRFPHAETIMNPLREKVPDALAWPDEAGGQMRFAEVARLEVVDKQQDHLLEALSTDAWKSRNWKLTFYGAGEDEVHIRRLINFYGLQSKVEIGGFVSSFHEIWANNHLHILPSRREGMPLALIESMACGRPALVTMAGGSPELVDQDISGFICPGMHPEVLNKTLERAWEKRGQWHTMGLAARTKICSVLHENWASFILSRIKAAAHL